MSSKIDLDIYEVAVLIDYYYMCEKGLITLDNMLILASLELRERAKNSGVEVAENFRNKNEIGMYLYILKKEIYNIENGLGSVNKLVYKVIELYKNDYEKFEEILEQVNYESKNKKYAYYRWFLKKIKTDDILKLETAYNSIDKIIIQSGVVKHILFQITDVNELVKIHKLINNNFKDNTRLLKFLSIYSTWVKKYIINNTNQIESDNKKEIPKDVLNNDEISNANIDENTNNEQEEYKVNQTVTEKTYSLNRYSNHAPKMEWFVEYFNKKNLFFEDNSLGVVMIPNFKRFLGDVKLYDKTGYTETAEIISNIGLENDIAWAIMLINLANTPQVNWYINNTNFEILINLENLKNKVSLYINGEYGVQSFMYSIKRLLKLPFGELGLGTLIYENEKAITIERKPWLLIEDIVVLYGLYNYLELINANAFDSDFYCINKNELFENTTNSDIVNFTNIFGVSRYDLDEILVRLADNYTDYLEFDDSSIFLKRDIASFDVLKIIESELNQFLNTGVENTDIENVDIENEKNMKDDILDIVLESFSTGYRLNSRMDYGKLLNNFFKKFEYSLELEMKEVESILKEKGFVINEIVILDKQFFIGDETAILNFLNDLDQLIYYEKLLDIFKESINPYMRDVDKLRCFIDRKTDTTYYSTDKYIQKNENKYITPEFMLRKCVEDWNYVITLKELENSLPYIPTYELERMLKAKQYLAVEKDAYMLRKLIHIDNTVIEDLKEVLTKNLEFNGHVTSEEFYNILNFDFNNILEENPMFKGNNAFVFKYFKTILDKDYSFNRNIISLQNAEVSTKGIWEDFLKNNDTFNIDTLKILQENTKVSTINYNLVMEYAIRLNENDYIRKDLIKFDVDEVDNSIEFLLNRQMYIATTSVEEFSIFPSVGYGWNCYILESYVKHYSKKYTLMQVGNFSKGCSSIIVSLESEFKNINEVFADLLIKNDIEDRSDSALNFLAENNYLSIRRYNEIDEVIKLIRK